MAEQPKGDMEAQSEHRREETKLTLRLSPEARSALETIARKRGGVSFAEAVRRAIGTELFLINEQDKDSRILIEDKNKNIRQLILR